VGLLLGGSMSASAAGLPQWLLGREWTSIPTTRPVVALTFDAGGDAAGVRSILHTLSARHARATFFFTGEWVQRYPYKAARIAETYRIGDHSMTHPHFTRLGEPRIRRQVLRSAAVIRNVTGANPAPLFRFPFGDRNARTIRIVNSIGYVPVGWTVDTLGWEGTYSGISATSIVRRVLANLQPGEIVLMHVGANPKDHSTLDADALPRLIHALRSHGYRLVTLNALLNAHS
jgi:peptidoglycan/xylan/chitin deacetylase (PgdA/CDA1 family)